MLHKCKFSDLKIGCDIFIDYSRSVSSTRIKFPFSIKVTTSIVWISPFISTVSGGAKVLMNGPFSINTTSLKSCLPLRFWSIFTLYLNSYLISEFLRWEVFTSAQFSLMKKLGLIIETDSITLSCPFMSQWDLI